MPRLFNESEFSEGMNKEAQVAATGGARGEGLIKVASEVGSTTCADYLIVIYTQQLDDEAKPAVPHGCKQND